VTAIDRLLERLERVKQAGEGKWQARCPAHHDRNPSLSVAVGASGEPLIHCHAGCTADAVLAAVGLAWTDLYERERREVIGLGSTIVATYDYVDEAGQLLYQVVRYEPKTFKQRRPSVGGGWTWKLGNARRVLYRLPSVLDAAARGLAIHVAEGEKCVQALEGAGVVATCNSGGAGKWQPEFAERLRGAAEVVVHADRDKQGLAHAQAVVASCQNIVPARLVQAAEGCHDIADHLAARHTLDEVVGAQPSVYTRPFAHVESRAVRFLVPKLLPLRTLTLVAGVGGLGKSTLLAGIAAGVSNGTYGEPADVLVITYEDTAEEVWRPRLLAAQGDLGRVHEVRVNLDAGGVVVLPEHFQDVEGLILERHARLVIVDPIVAAIDTEYDAHKDQHVRAILGRLVKIAEDADCAVAGVGHLNKAPTQTVFMRIANSAAFWNAARSVVLVTEGADEDERLVTQVKANWSARLVPQRYRVEEIVLPEELDAATGQPIVTSRLVYVEDVDDLDLDTLLADRAGRDGSTKTVKAAALLAEMLADGEWHEAAGLKKLAVAAGIKERTFQLAAQELGVETERRGFQGGTWWRLQAPVAQSPCATEPPQSRKPCHTQTCATADAAQPCGAADAPTPVAQSPLGPPAYGAAAGGTRVGQAGSNGLPCGHPSAWLAGDGRWRCATCNPPALDGEVVERRTAEVVAEETLGNGQPTDTDDEFPF
jgi:hypothetical protein